MSWKSLFLVFALFFSLPIPSYATLLVSMRLVDAEGNGMNIGSVKLDDTLYGLILTPNLHDIPAGFHGFHVHSLPDCSDYALAAAGHFDPELNYQHKGPYRGSGHLGDLPVLPVNFRGKATLPILAPRLKLSQIVGRSLVIVAGGDNYSDDPLKPMGSHIRIACGVIPYH